MVAKIVIPLILAGLLIAGGPSPTRGAAPAGDGRRLAPAGAPSRVLAAGGAYRLMALAGRADVPGGDGRRRDGRRNDGCCCLAYLPCIQRMP